MKKKLRLLIVATAACAPLMATPALAMLLGGAYLDYAVLHPDLAHHTGQSVDTIARDTDRDNFMDPQQALDYGLIDKVFEHRKVDAAELKR